MSMSTHVKGFVPPDEKWKQMKAVWDSCQQAGIDPPKEVSKFFNHEEPNDNGMEKEIPHKYWSEGMREGIEVEVDKIPKEVKIIRFYNSY